MTYQALIDQIKVESRIKVDDNFLLLIIGLLNELCKEAVLSERPFELKAELTIPLITNTRLADIPTDFFVHHEILFKDSDTQRIYQLQDEDGAAQPAPRGLYGHPKTFEILGSQIFIKPYAGIVTGDNLYLVYYKTPPTITTANLLTENPLKRLEPFLTRAAIRRIRMFHSDDMQVAQMFTGDISSAAKAFAKDEPEQLEDAKKQ